MPTKIELTLSDCALVDCALKRYLEQTKSWLPSHGGRFPRTNVSASHPDAAVHNRAALSEMALRIAEIVTERVEASL